MKVAGWRCLHAVSMRRRQDAEGEGGATPPRAERRLPGRARRPAVYLVLDAPIRCSSILVADIKHILLSNIMCGDMTEFLSLQLGVSLAVSAGARSIVPSSIRCLRKAASQVQR